MSGEINIVARTIKDAFTSKKNADELLANPAAVFRRNGLNIQKGDEQAFNNHFNEVAGNVITRLKQTPEARLVAAHEELMQIPGIGCTFCTIGATSVAVVIVAVGVGGIAALTIESGAVVALAAFAGVEATTAMGFIVGLGSAISGGVSAVAQRICQWTGAC